MSQENVEIVRRGAEATLRGDLDVAFEACDPEIEWQETPGLGPDAATYRGVAAAREAVSKWFGMWSEYEAEVRRYVDAGDSVVVLILERGRGKGSGAVVERELGQIHTLHDGKIVRTRLFGSWNEALEAPGVRD